MSSLVFGAARLLVVVGGVFGLVQSGRVFRAVFLRNVLSYFSGLLGYLFIVAFVLAAGIMAFPMQFFTDNLLNLDHLVSGELHGGVAQRHVHQDATVVDALVDVVVGQLGVGQRPQGLADRPHGLNVLLAIGHHLGHERSVFAELAIGLRHRQQTDQLAASVVLAHVSASEAAHVLQ